MIDYGCLYKSADNAMVRVCGMAHSLFDGEDVILFSYIEQGTTSDAYYCTEEVFNKRFTPVGGMKQ